MSHIILLLDDDGDFRRLVKAWLERRGHRVIEADTGRVAHKLMDDVKPHLVIVDGLLPDTDGFRWIKARRDAGDETPMIFTSFFYKDMDSYKRLTGELRVKRVVAKTAGQHDFVKEVDMALGLAPPPAGAAAGAPAPLRARASVNLDTTAAAPVPVAVRAPAPKPAPTKAPVRASNIADLIDDSLGDLPRRR
jgi:CheY-like chemotaxis protein